jgi:hypothetical protein
MAVRLRRYLPLVLSAALLTACSGATLGAGHPGSGGLTASGGTGGGGTAGTYQVSILDGAFIDKVDLLFMIDNSSSMTSMQQKLMSQLPAFFQTLEALPTGLPDLHIAVVSSDMGAPGDSTSSIGCTTAGDQGMFQSKPQGTCTATTLSNGSTFISEGGGTSNFTNPIDQVMQCIGLLGQAGCGFEQPLHSITRALGADGNQVPANNANFLRPDAILGIVILTNEDDCSAPANTTIFSLNGGAQTITNPDGPITNYRCNGGPRGGHYCKDPAAGQMMIPPLAAPLDAAGNPPILNLDNCQDNPTGTSALTPVSQFVQEIKTLKSDPDHQIVVAAITAPPDPYSVEWVPSFGPTSATAGQVWPQVMHSCGAPGGDLVNPLVTQGPSDGSFGDPAVRIAQFVNAFANSALGSICDASYTSTLTAVASKLGDLIINSSCVTPGANIQTDSQGNPACTVTDYLIDANGNQTTTAQVPNCNENGAKPPCWTLDAGACPTGSEMFRLTADQATMSAVSAVSRLTCSLCQPGSALPGCG